MPLTAFTSQDNHDNVVVYALPTHPGHHATCANFSGFCYVNNAAVAARALQYKVEDL